MRLLIFYANFLIPPTCVLCHIYMSLMKYPSPYILMYIPLYENIPFGNVKVAKSSFHHHCFLSLA